MCIFFGFQEKLNAGNWRSINTNQISNTNLFLFVHIILFILLLLLNFHKILGRLLLRLINLHKTWILILILTK